MLGCCGGEGFLEGADGIGVLRVERMLLGTRGFLRDISAGGVGFRLLASIPAMHDRPRRTSARRYRSNGCFPVRCARL